MMTLDQYRQAIDQIDTQILSLLVERMHIAHEVGRYKKAHRVTVEDRQREQTILDRLAEMADDPLTREYITEIFTAIFHAAKDIQQKQQSASST